MPEAEPTPTHVDRRSHRVMRSLITLGVTVLAQASFISAPASAYSTPAEVPNPFQDYSARDYADALWNLETNTGVRTHERVEHEECDVQQYTVTDPLDESDVSTYFQVISPEDTWCEGAEGDELREEFDQRADEESEFFHGLPYEDRRDSYYGVWADVNGNGFTSRTEIHARDLDNEDFVVSGVYFDHYNGETVNIAETETAGEHMVPVGFTWPEMQHRSQQDRVDYYNDPMNLTSTVGPTNRFKDGKTPSEWMPDHEPARCPYALSWTHITSKHDVSLYQSDINFLRDTLWDCIEEQIDDGGILDPAQRSADLEWAAMPPEGLVASESAPSRDTNGPRSHRSGLDYADALWNLQREVQIRSVEREEHDSCDVQTYTVTHPRTGEEATYARVLTPENTYCRGEEGDELREELDEQAEEEESFHHGRPLSGQRAAFFGHWQTQDGVTTGHRVLNRDLREVQWNSNATGVRSGWFYDPFTSDREQYRPGQTVVGSVLPVEHAWIEMEHRSDEQRHEFHNDPMNLLATTADQDNEKGASGPRDWFPEHEGFGCRYALLWTHSAVTHDISLFSSDIRQLRSTLYRCMNDADEQESGSEDTRSEDLEWVSVPPG